MAVSGAARHSQMRPSRLAPVEMGAGRRPPLGASSGTGRYWARAGALPR
jgi:hypothetical protein